MSGVFRNKLPLGIEFKQSHFNNHIMFTTISAETGNRNGIIQGEFPIWVTFETEFKGRGGWNLIAHVDYEGQTSTHTTYTTNSMFIDSLSDIESYDEKQLAIMDYMFNDDVVFNIVSWCEEVQDELAQDN
jgi:hypothetical protein